MNIERIGRDECLEVLARVRLMRLACAADNQPYIVPVYLAYHRATNGEDCLYGYATLGQKVLWMRQNPRVCVEVDEVRSQSEWISVIAFGDYEELPEIQEQAEGRPPSRSLSQDSSAKVVLASHSEGERFLAQKLLESRAVWWEPATTFRLGAIDSDQSTQLTSIVYKIHLTQISGFRSRQKGIDSFATNNAAIAPGARTGWFLNLVSRLSPTSNR